VRKIVNSTYMTLDGDMWNMKDWHFDYVGEQAKRAGHDLLFGSDALIMGRVTYDGFAPSWSSRAGTDEFADRMNSIDKYVVSSTLTDPEWTNTSVIRSDVAAEIRRLKQQPGEGILQYGFGDVTRLMLEHDLLDELRIWLHPVLSGNARPHELLYRDMPQTRFALADADLHETGLAILTYTRATSE
jgi:dihydrofolate reductase